MRHLTVCLMLFIFASFVSLTPLHAETAEDKGLAIAMEAEERNNGFGDFTAEMVMILKNRHGQESVRKIRTKTLEVPGDGDKGISIFDTPRDVKGTAFLTYSHKVGDDDQWLYLPALKRVKRISSSNKSGSFMGSEFAYEDISSQEVEKYRYKYLRDEVYDGQDCFVNELYPIHPKSGYTRIVMWLDKAEYRVLKMDFYDRKNSFLKTLTFKGYKKYINNFWKPDEMYIVNHRTGKSTRLLWKNYKFKTGLTDKDFNKNALKRVR